MGKMRDDAVLLRTGRRTIPGQALRISKSLADPQGCAGRRCARDGLWPQLATLRLSDAASASRSTSIGGSDANVIFSASAERIVHLWGEKRGEQATEDLSDKLPVMLGCWTEEFNRQWYTFSTGRTVTRVGESLRCTSHAWRTCTLDGFVEDIGAVWEAKHTSSFVKPDEVLARYMPQLQHNMAVAGCERAILSVIFGNGKWEVFEIASDWLYQEDLLTAETHFWNCVQSGELPAVLPPPPAPRPVAVREICFEGHNAWAASAADWLKHREAAKIHQCAIGTIKDLVEEDVSRAFGHGIDVRRSKAGALTIRELKA